MDVPQTIALVVHHILVEDGGEGDSSHHQQGIGHIQILGIHLPHFPELSVILGITAKEKAQLCQQCYKASSKQKK